MIIRDMKPLCEVEKQGFRKALSYFQPKYKIK